MANVVQCGKHEGSIDINNGRMYARHLVYFKMVYWNVTTFLDRADRREKKKSSSNQGVKASPS